MSKRCTTCCATDRAGTCKRPAQNCSTTERIHFFQTERLLHDLLPVVSTDVARRTRGGTASPYRRTVRSVREISTRGMIVPVLDNLLERPYERV